MAFRLVSSAGGINDPVFVNVSASGVITPNTAVELALTSGVGVAPAGITTTGTILFGVALDYAQGLSDVSVKVIPFSPEQLWEVDCANAATTAQIGIRQYLSANRGFVHNQATDAGGPNRVFLPLAMTGSTTGSGKLLGRFIVSPGQV